MYVPRELVMLLFCLVDIERVKADCKPDIRMCVWNISFTIIYKKAYLYIIVAVVDFIFGICEKIQFYQNACLAKAKGVYKQLQYLKFYWLTEIKYMTIFHRVYCECSKLCCTLPKLIIIKTK